MSNLLSPSATSSQKLGDPNEDVDGVHVDAHAGVDRIKRRSSVSYRVSLSSVDDLLSVVQHESSEEDEATVHGHAVETCSHGCGWREEC